MNKYIFFILIFLGVGLFTNIHSQRYRQIKNLNSQWSFSVGDNIAWRLTQHDYSSWDKIYTGRDWESQGYSGYNGYAWYKRQVNITGVQQGISLYLKISNIDDADEVYFNGILIGKSGSFPPNVITAFNNERIYCIPASLVRYNLPNIIAVRVYDCYLNGGITGDIGIFQDEASRYLLSDLSGLWKFKPGNNHSWNEKGYDDTSWANINVPGIWENQGYENMDGFAWYRKTFSWNGKVDSENLMLVLGRIDDYDEVYLNGQYIGSLDDLVKKDEYFVEKEHYRTIRAYKIPENLLKNGDNTIAVMVNDVLLEGGIFDGPVGIMTERGFENYFEKYEYELNLFDFIQEMIFD